MAPESTPESTPEPTRQSLTDLERNVLLFADLRWRYLGARETAIRQRFGWTETRYAQVLNALLERPEAAAYAPVLVGRLRRLAAARRQQRTGNSHGGADTR